MFGASKLGFGAPAVGNPETGFEGTSAALLANSGTRFGGSGIGGFGSGAPGPTTATGGFGNLTSASGASAMCSVNFPSAVVKSNAPPTSATDPYRFDLDTRSAIVNYLCEVDRAYNALDPKCRFRSFVFNVCGSGQAEGAIQRDRYIAYMHGGGCSEEDWVQAVLANPDPQRLYPTPLHFAQELQQRCEKQKEEIRNLSNLIEGYLSDVEAIVALDKENQVALADLKREDVLLRRRWYVLMQKMETLRRLGHSDGEEGLLLQQLQRMRQELSAPGRYRNVLGQIQSCLAKAWARRCNCGGGGGEATAPHPSSNDRGEEPLLHTEVDRVVMEGWLKFTSRAQTGIEALHELLQKDLRDMQSVRNRITAI